MLAWGIEIFFLGRFLADPLSFYSRLKWLMRHAGVGSRERGKRAESVESVAAMGQDKTLQMSAKLIDEEDEAHFEPSFTPALLQT